MRRREKFLNDCQRNLILTLMEHQVKSKATYDPLRDSVPDYGSSRPYPNCQYESDDDWDLVDETTPFVHQPQRRAVLETEAPDDLVAKCCYLM